MTVDLNELLELILYFGLIILVIIFIILGIRLIKTLSKVDRVIDDVNGKMTALDGVFDIIDKTTDYAASISDKITNGLTKLVSTFLKKRKGNDNNE